MVDAGVSFTVTIAPHGWCFEAQPSVSLLASARNAGFTLPSSCRNGTCRTCLCRLVAGEVRYSIEWPGVSIDEKLEGLILPCVATPASDVVIEVPAAKDMRATV
ncbi:2Fe-2S iron-sulfur cluster-binding protein [soil metagenome]